MNPLEELVRDTLAARAHDVDAHDLASASAGARPARRWAAIATVVAVAAAIVVAIVLVAPWRGDPERSTTPASLPSPPAGMQWVSFHGITLTVPESWAVSADPCATPATSAVAVLAGAPSKCPEMPSGTAGSTTITLAPLADATPLGGVVTIGGNSARRAVADTPGPSGLVLYQLPDVGVRITVSAVNVSAGEAVVTDLEYTPVDHLGCTTRQPPWSGTMGSVRATTDLRTVSSAVVCEYGGSDTDATGDLLGSRVLGNADVDALRTVVDSARPVSSGVAIAGVGVGGPHAGMHEYRLRRADGSSLVVFVDLGGRPVEIWDDLGRWSVISGPVTQSVDVPHAYPN